MGFDRTGPRRGETLRDDRTGRRKRPLALLIPLAFFGTLAFAILYNEVSGFRAWVLGYINPARDRAEVACRTLALQTTRNPGFARMIRHGRGHATHEGFYVDRVIIGEMGEEGGEQRYETTCYVDKAGRVLRSHRQVWTPTAETEDPDNPGTISSHLGQTKSPR